MAGNIHDLPPHPIEVPFTVEAKSILREYESRLVDAIKKETGTGLEAMYNRSTRDINAPGPHHCKINGTR
jgi:hypothetical protein